MWSRSYRGDAATVARPITRCSVPECPVVTPTARIRLNLSLVLSSLTVESQPALFQPLERRLIIQPPPDATVGPMGSR